MEKKLLIANWKSHKTQSDAQAFFDDFLKLLPSGAIDQTEVVIAPPFTLLSFCRNLIDSNHLPISLASQDVSSYPEGPYTGEVNARLVKEFAKYVIVGHSERIRYGHESIEEIIQKIKLSHECGLSIIQCVQDENSHISEYSDIVAYEPPDAISTFGVGKPDDPEHVRSVLQKISQRSPHARLLYGGSIKKENVSAYNAIDICAGFLVGGASLEASSFTALL